MKLTESEVVIFDVLFNTNGDGKLATKLARKFEKKHLAGIVESSNNGIARELKEYLELTSGWHVEGFRYNIIKSKPWNG